MFGSSLKGHLWRLTTGKDFQVKIEELLELGIIEGLERSKKTEIRCLKRSALEALGYLGVKP